jgi:hypothetical protein
MANIKKKTSRTPYWQKHISQWSESGLTQAEYCRRNKLSAAAFNWWKRHLRKKSKSQKNPSTSMQFVEVHGVTPANVGRSENYEILLSRGRAIRVDRDFDSDVLRRLIVAVES